MGKTLFTFLNKDSIQEMQVDQKGHNKMEVIIQKQLETCLGKIQIEKFTCNGVILEKNFKLYCSLASLIQNVVAEDKDG